MTRRDAHGCAYRQLDTKLYLHLGYRDRIFVIDARHAAAVRKRRPAFAGAQDEQVQDRFGRSSSLATNAVQRRAGPLSGQTSCPRRPAIDRRAEIPARSHVRHGWRTTVCDVIRTLPVYCNTDSQKRRTR